MKIRIWSDLHTEFSPFLSLSEHKDEVLVLAGDITLTNRDLDNGIMFENYTSKFHSVVMVAGNHESYNSSLQDTYKYFKSLEKKFSNFYFLEDSFVGIEDVMFIGSTLWTKIPDDFKLDVQRGMNDFHIIEELRPVNNYAMRKTDELHDYSIAYIKHMCREYRNVKKVVVTHHAPSMRSVHPRFKGDILNYAFGNRDDEVVFNSGAKLWIHGHMHNAVDYMIGETRVVCNPRGYQPIGEYKEKNTGFDKDKVIEI